MPIAEVLEHELPASGVVLEIASGSGEHAVFMARRFPDLTWQPSDRDPEALVSVDAYAAEAGVPNLLPAITLDAAGADWPVIVADAILCVNMVHISPWEATVGLFSTAAKVMHEGSPLILYGPYIEDGVPTAESNLAFDSSLKERDPDWGLRNLSQLDALAETNGLARTARYEMPANNLVVVFRTRIRK